MSKKIRLVHSDLDCYHAQSQGRCSEVGFELFTKPEKVVLWQGRLMKDTIFLRTGLSFALVKTVMQIRCALNRSLFPFQAACI